MRALRSAADGKVATALVVAVSLLGGAPVMLVCAAQARGGVGGAQIDRRLARVAGRAEAHQPSGNRGYAEPPLPAASGPHGGGAAQTGGARRLRPLHDFEEGRRRLTDFAALPAGDLVTGPDPYAIRALPGGDRFVSILRGASALVLLDAALRVIHRLPTPRAPTGLAISETGDIFVSSELSSEIVRFRAAGTSLQRTGTLAMPMTRAVRDLTAGPGDLLHAVDEHGGRLLTVRLGATDADGAIARVSVRELPVGRGPIRVMRVGSLIAVNSLLDHEIGVWRVDDEGWPTVSVGRVRHDGPIWSFDLLLDGGHAVLVVGGVEDHPLDRTGGSFGFIDSFLSVYQISSSAPAEPRLLTAVNLSALGVVTPKVISARADRPDGALRVLVSGYGTTPLVTLTWPRDRVGAPTIACEDLAPGTTSLARRADGALVFAAPLLDAWLVHHEGRMRTVPVPEDEGTASQIHRDPLSRVGEALLFTTLMAPWNKSDGPLSRFTCETCHFEMYVDGRTHHTGRGDVRATTKPLRGLFNNRPHFSRALDADLATVADNEFRVAGANSGHDSWFSVRTQKFPWLRTLGVTQPGLTPLTLRKALMTSLMALGHVPNPAVTRGGSWTPSQRAGAALFRDRCEGCHQARLVSDDEATRAPFIEWERLIMNDTEALVWGEKAYHQTGVTPYVHERGARVPSLRRLYKKAPYFTNGSAPDLENLLTRVRWTATRFFHDGAPADTPSRRLSPEEVQQLRSFLDLL